MSLDKQHELTVRGVYQDTPENTAYHFDFVAPIYAGGGYIGVEHGDVMTFIILFSVCAMGWTEKKSIVRYTRLCKNIILILLMMNGEAFMMHSHCPKFIWMTQIPVLAFTFMVFGLCYIFVAIMNYVLVAIATMSRRAKSIGVHKCSGAVQSTFSVCFFLRQGLWY